MIKREFINNRFYKFLTVVLLFLAFLVLFKGSPMGQERKDFKKAEDEIIVVFNKELGDNDLLLFADKFGDSIQIKKHIGDYALFTVKNASDLNSVLDSMNTEPQVQTAEANSRINILSYDSDPYSDTQWYINNPGHYTKITNTSKRNRYSEKGMDMDVKRAWESMEGVSTEQEVIVAIIDTGVDYAHPDLSENMWVNDDEIDGDHIDNDKNGYVDDVYGWDFYNDDASVCHYEYPNYKMGVLTSDNDDHGTHIAGIIGAVANNDIGIAGIASNINIKLMPLKINGGVDGSGETSDAIEAIKYATMMGAKICNISWGTSVEVPGLEEIMKESDMLFVAASGNSGVDIDDEPIYPANFKLDNLITVTPVNSWGELTSYSNFGQKTVDLAAPGDDIYSTVVGSYSTMSGSSMAAPQVSAVAALLYAYSDHIYASNVKDIITKNIKPIKELDDYMINGGIPSAYKVIMASEELTSDNEPPVMSFQTIYDKGNMLVPIRVVDSGYSKVRVLRWIYGNKEVEDFKRGVEGTLIEDNQAVLKKAGTYTFYASDYAGNETVKTYEVMADETAPKLNLSYTVADNYSYRTVQVLASDRESGLRRVKYLPGIKSREDFLPAGAGTTVPIKEGKGAFLVKEDGIYTIFALDNRGNITIKKVNIKTVKATHLRISANNITMDVCEQYSLFTYMKPTESTDRITYSSLNEKVASVSASGKITAISPGIAYIMARTSSKISTICIVTVKLKE